MIVLASTTDIIQAVVSSSVTTNQLRCFACWRDITSSTYVAGRTVTNTNNTTAVSVVTAPAASTQRVVDLVNIYNADTTSKEITVRFYDNGTTYDLWKGILEVGEICQYTNDQGWVQKFTGVGSLLALAADNEVNANKAVRANDSRLSNSRNPLAHTHTLADLSNFAVTTPSSEDILAYNSTTSKWSNVGKINFTDGGNF